MIADRAAYQLIHDGALVLSQVESNGIAIDVPYLDRMLTKTAEKIKRLKAELATDPIAKEWRKRFGEKTNLGSRPQLAELLFDVMGHKCHVRTKTGRPSADVSNLERLKIPFVNAYVELEKLKKLNATYLKGIRREVVDGILRPSFSLHTTSSYRSSSQDPNFQNQPVRDPFAAKLIRRAFIPRPGNVLLEIDYAAIEVRISAAYHKDPTMLTYIETGYDMHKDMAVECFKIEPHEVTKQLRHTAKNGFVFPSFYGDYYLSIAKNMWDTVKRMEMMTTSGLSMVDHFKQVGITRRGACEPGQSAEPGTFEKHIQQVENRFWNERFPKYKQWREWIWAKYQEQGWIKTKTGFVVQGVLKRNEVINLPVQGSAFHCLLWSLIQMQRWLSGSRLETLIIGQIHDSMLLDVPKHELSDVLGMAREIMCERIRQEWIWIITPLDVEAEGSDVNWYEKKAIKI